MYLEITYTVNHVDSEKFDKLIIGKVNENEKIVKRKFELYDDDDNLYFEGEVSCNEEADNSEEFFIPLDTIGASYGCTYIKYTNDEGVFEIL